MGCRRHGQRCSPPAAVAALPLALGLGVARGVARGGGADGPARCRHAGGGRSAVVGRGRGHVHGDDGVRAQARHHVRYEAARRRAPGQEREVARARGGRKGNAKGSLGASKPSKTEKIKGKTHLPHFIFYL